MFLEQSFDQRSLSTRNPSVVIEITITDEHIKGDFDTSMTRSDGMHATVEVIFDQKLLIGDNEDNV